MKLLQLLIDNKAHSARIEATAPTVENAVVIRMEGVISADYGLAARDLSAALTQAGGADVVLEMNSPGGDVFEGRAMAAAIAQYPGTVTARVIGLAASAMTCVSSACDTVEMFEGAMFMVHKASTIAWGNADDLTKTAALLNKVDGAIVADYVRKTGQAEAQISDWVAAETWFTAQEAVDNGFANAIITNTKGAPAATWNLSVYQNAPQDGVKPTPKNHQNMTDEHRERQQQRLRMLERLAVS
jgi:ATP-dependent Clp protease, protease subunit